MRAGSEEKKNGFRERKTGTGRLRRGSITVFLSLMLILMLAVIMASVNAVRTAGGRAQLANAADQSLWSLFARYDRDLLEDYDLFFIDAGYGTSSLRLSQAADRLEEAASYICEPDRGLLTGGKDLLSLSDLHVALTGYTLASDMSFGVYAAQAIEYMKETEAEQGISLIREHYASLDADQTAEQENYADAAESEIPEGGFDELKQEAETEKTSEEDSSDTSGESDTSASLLDPQTYADAVSGARAVNGIESLRKTSVLNFVLQDPESVSGRTLDASVLPGSRETASGMGVISLSESPDSGENALLFNEYIVLHFGNVLDPEKGEGLHYPLEQIIAWKNSDIKNLEAVANRILLIREGINLVHLYSDAELRSQASAVAAALSCLLLMPELEQGLEALILVGWAYCESLLDVRTLFAGQYVPVVKSADSWQLSSLADITKLASDKDSVRKTDARGLDYQDYLRIFLMLMSEEDKVSRSADMIEHEIRSGGRENFRFDNCLDTLTIEMSLKSENMVTLTTEKTFSYRESEQETGG